MIATVSRLEGENKPLTSIRGVAAMWVVLDHFPGSKGVFTTFSDYGYASVDLFFILSGLILAHVYRDLSRPGMPMFFLRRACRLYPLHIVSSLALLVILVLTDRTILDGRPSDFAAALLLIHPFLPEPAIAVANPPSWSIGIELACYLAFPVLIATLRPLRSRFAQVALVALLLVAEALVQIRYSGEIRGIGALARGFAGFLLGMAIWRLASQMRVGTTLLTIGEAASLGGALAAGFLGRAELVPLFFALLLFCLFFDAGAVARLLRRPFWLWLGHISFSIYLVHFLVISVAITWLPARLMPIHGGIGRTLWDLLLIAAVLGFSHLTYRLIEVPGRRIPNALMRRRYERPAAPVRQEGEPANP